MAVLALVACVPPVSAYPLPDADIESVVYPEHYMGAGEHFEVVVPPRWQAQSRVGYGVLTHRDHDATVYVFSGVAKTCDELVAQRMGRVGYPLVRTTVDDTRGGRVRVMTYDTGDPSMHCQGYARRDEGRWYVVLCRVAISDLDARFLYIERILSGFRILHPGPRINNGVGISS